jgi:hypothetical protein
MPDELFPGLAETLSRRYLLLELIYGDIRNSRRIPKPSENERRLGLPDRYMNKLRNSRAIIQNLILLF